ncbi:MAG: hypothetical protein LQ338_000749 [Usnochroma carphineum]|nr:MAG: hypothetical protein LQ338_000749 [Usnochroma carphineum]
MQLSHIRRPSAAEGLTTERQRLHVYRTMSHKRKERDSPHIPGIEIPDSEEKRLAQSMAPPTTPTRKRSRLTAQPEQEAGAEGASSFFAPIGELGAQGSSREGMVFDPSDPSPIIPYSTAPVVTHVGKGKGKGKEVDPWSDPDSFPICIYYSTPIFMMANSKWTLEQFQQEMLTALEMHGLNCDMLELLGWGNLTVVWESNPRTSFKTGEFPPYTVVGRHNIRAVLEFLKRKRSDLVIVECNNRPVKEESIE